MNLQQAVDLARMHMDRHGLRDWSFRLNKNKRRLGVCRFDERRIELSAFFVLHNEDPLILDTILHEIAHALVGPRHGHGPVWKAMAGKLGCEPRSCCAQAKMPSGRYQAACPSCTKVYHRHRRPRRVQYFCAECGEHKGGLRWLRS